MQPETLANRPALDRRIQFTVRSMLIVTTVVAIALAIVAPWFHQWTAQQRRTFFLVWCNLGVSAGSTIVIATVLRMRSEKEAGPARFRLLPSMTRTAASSTVLLTLFWCTLFVSYSFAKTQLLGGGAAVAAPFVDITAIQYGAMFAFGALGIWWRSDSSELCDAGILRGFQFIPWKSIRGFRWGTCDPNILVLQCGWSITTLLTAPDEKTVVGQFLAERLQREPR